MHPIEFWWLYDAKRPVKMYGNLTEADVKSLSAAVDEYKAPHSKNRRERVARLISKVKRPKQREREK